MKKILALVVAFALCFTAIGGCLTTFAADVAADAALAVNAPDDLVAFNSAEIAVVVSGTGYTAYAAQELKVTFPDALTLKSIDGIDEFDAVGQANYKVATADGVTTVTLVQETPGDTFELTFKLGLAAANQSGYIKTYTVAASAEVGTDVDDPVLYTVAEASDSFDVDCSHGAVKLAFDATGHWYECPCYVDSCDIKENFEEHSFGEDNICTVCNYAKVEEPEECEHVWDDGVVTTKPTNDAEGVKTYTCTLCGETKTEAVPAVQITVDNNITMASAVNLTEYVNFRPLFDKIPACDDFYVEVKHDRCDASYNFVEGGYTDTIYKNDARMLNAGTRYYFLYNNLRMYELNFTIYLTVYCLDADDNVIYKSQTFETSVADNAKTGYESAAKSNKTATMNLYTDIINLASAAQTYFVGTKDCDLADIALPNEGFTGTPSAEVDKATLNTINQSTPSGSLGTITASVNLAGNPAVRYVVGGLSNYNKADLKLVVGYDSPKYGEITETYNVADLQTVDANRSLVVFSRVALCDGNKTITAKLYNGEVAEENLIVTNEYSVETAAYNAKSTASNYALYGQITRLGVSARAHFNTN